MLALLSACESDAAERRNASTREAGAMVMDASDKIVARARGPLVDPNKWKMVSASEDPFADRPPDPSCPSDAYMSELLSGEEVFSVNTGACSYITAHQPALRDVAKGEHVNARVWHFALNAGESATAHVALRLGESTLIDEIVPIPSEGGLLAIDQATDRAIPQGAPVFFHLHNHGDNSWSLVELSAGPAKP